MNAVFSWLMAVSEVPDDLNMKDGVVPQQTIKVGKQRMDGRTLLNYSRFRKDDEGVFGRINRQQRSSSLSCIRSKDQLNSLRDLKPLGKSLL